MIQSIEIYVIQDDKGYYFPAKNYKGHNWTDDIKFARIYTKLPPARTIVTQTSKQYPDKPIPVILKMAAFVTEVMNETERVKEAKEKIINEKQMQEVNNAKWKLKQAEKDLQKAEEQMIEAKKQLGLL